MNNITWVTAVARRHTPLLLSIVISGEQDPLLVRNQTGLSITYAHMRRKGIALQYDKKELAVNSTIVHNEISKYGITFFDDYSRRCIQSCKKFLQITECVEKQSNKINSLPILKAQLKQYFDAAIASAPHLIVLISVQSELENFLNEFVAKRISGATQRETILTSLKITLEKTEEITNLERLIKLGQLVQKKVPNYKTWITANPLLVRNTLIKEFPVIWKSILHYQKDFGWMGRMYYAGNPITELDIVIRLQNSLRHNCTHRLNKIETERKQQLIEREKAIAKLGGDDASLLADIIARYMYLRSHRLNVYFMAHEHALRLLAHAAQILKLDNGIDDIIFLDWREVLGGLDGRITKQKLRNNITQRQQNFEFLSIKGKTKWLSTKKSSKTLKGIPACTGIYTGRVRLILTDEAMFEMTPGEVLVTTMTTPSLMLAIEKAGAIITDEGGMLCHAAIVSRELNIPCVIATQKATKVLKDGDLVEVDAEKGLVKLLE